MTDEQIIKNFRNGVYKNKPMLFGQKFLESVLDLINRQKAEIEQWKEEADRWQNAFCKVNEDMPTIKSEAIKEFAHLVIDRSKNGVICVSDVPDLVKEITKER